MREFVKGACVLVILASLLTLALAWVDDRPNQTTHFLRFAPILLALIAFVVFLRLHYQRDLAPDYLTQYCGTFFDRGGLCFAPILSDMDGVCVLCTYFQNRFDRPCTGRIALRPAKGFLGRPNMDVIAFEVACDGGAFGVHRMAVGVPTAIQGRKVKFEVGASVDFPQGRGSMLRFRDGIVLRSDAVFRDQFTRSVTIAGALGGAIVISRPAGIEVQVPMNVPASIPGDIEAHVSILWRPGDIPLA
jgi:hypothetical protein